MFLGTYTPKLDDKGRLTLPAKFRDALAGGLMVTKSQDHSLAVYPRAQFELLAQRASQTSRSNPEARGESFHGQGMHLIGLHASAQGGINLLVARNQAFAFKGVRHDRGIPMASVTF